MSTSAPRRTEGEPSRRVARASRAVAALLLSLGFAGCASGASTRAALHGDLPSLKAAIAQSERQGRLGTAPVQELAQAVLRRELSSLEQASDTFPPLGPCVRRIRSVLEDVAEGPTEFAGAASVLLIEGGFAPPRASSDTHSAASMLTVSARQAVGTRAGERRRAFLLHGDAGVRRAAALAAFASADPEDVTALLESARLDPDAEVRAVAVRALGRVGGTRAVLGLRDLWATASPEQRRVIVVAWSMQPSFEAGGERQLTSVVEETSGEAAVIAALALEQKAAGPPGLATGALSRAMAGTRAKERLLALDGAPWQNPELKAGIMAARKHADAATRVIVLLRLIEHDAIDAEGMTELRSLAAEPSVPVAIVARAALARAGDAAVKPKLRADLAAPRADHRTLAALALVTLDDWAGAAHALGDDSPSVRRSVACQMLADPKARASHPDLRPPLFGALAPEVVTLLSPS